MSALEKITLAKWSFAAMLLSPGYLLAGCEAPSELDGDAAVPDDVGNDGAGDDQLRAWTGYTSEETPPLTCGHGQVVQGLDCTGKYCDNVALYCTNTGRATGWGTWLPYFSEEGSGAANEGHCAAGDMWMTGLGCSGSYCDNVSMQCSQMIGSWTGGCLWSPQWYSEEQAPFYAPHGYYIKGIKCGGSYCDNMRYLYCQML
jgi:hypothetical protein